MKKIIASILELAEVAIIAVGAVVLVRTFLAQPFLVSGSSMVPTFSNGDYLLVDELTYRIREPERGEVVVFHFPKDVGTFFIKRIIGLPGEKVVVKNGKMIIVNKENPSGFRLEESYLPHGFDTAGSFEVEIGAGEYFVMGDNRSFSYDSRSWGALPDKDIVGLVRLRLWPLGSFQAFAAPQYFH